MIRLDKFLCDNEVGSRSQVKEMVKKGRVKVNLTIVRKPECKINEDTDQISVDDRLINHQALVYYMLHKPSGVITATKDSMEKTVLDLMEVPKKKELFPVGRLDKDTEGLLLITNDGELSHQLLSPKKHVPKTYYLITKENITEKMSKDLEAGVDIGEKKLTQPAFVQMLSDKEMNLTITEGKFHQVKRMLKAVKNEVVYLKRIQMGSLQLDPALNKGEYRALTKDEIALLVSYKEKVIEESSVNQEEVKC